MQGLWKNKLKHYRKDNSPAIMKRDGQWNSRHEDFVTPKWYDENFHTLKWYNWSRPGTRKWFKKYYSSQNRMNFNNWVKIGNFEKDFKYNCKNQILWDLY